MAVTRIYESTNDYSNFQVPTGQQLGVNGAVKQEFKGWCAAASARWCHHVLQGNDPRGLNPVGDEANRRATGVLKGTYNWDCMNQNLIEDSIVRMLRSRLGLNANKWPSKYYLDGMLNKMSINPGIYVFENNTHVMAASTLNNSLFFYDIESGLWMFDTVGELQAKIHGDYLHNQGRQWEATLCTF
jgi:hypothetical protein